MIVSVDSVGGGSVGASSVLATIVRISHCFHASSAGVGSSDGRSAGGSHMIAMPLFKGKTLAVAAVCIDMTSDTEWMPDL